MFGFNKKFKKLVTVPIDISSTIVEKVNKASAQKKIEEIHNAFYTEVDKLLVQANILKSLDTDKEVLIRKAKELKELGFINSSEVKEADIEIARLEKIKKENLFKEKTVAAVFYFGTKYPNYKFITKESVNTLCEKYGLICGSVSQYIGTVPNRNLQHIKDFKINEVDCIFLRRYRDFSLVKEINYSEYLLCQQNNVFNEKAYNFHLMSSLSTVPLEIVAPEKDFNMSGYTVRENWLVPAVKDPIVLHPVMFQDTKYYLIVTAWGDEASDELVVNQQMN